MSLIERVFCVKSLKNRPLRTLSIYVYIGRGETIKELTEGGREEEQEEEGEEVQEEEELIDEGRMSDMTLLS